MPWRDSWVTKVDAFGQMKPISATNLVYKGNAREVLYNTFIG